MGVLYAKIDDDLEKKFRKEIIDRFGTSRGALKQAVEEAITLWLNPKTTPQLNPASSMPKSSPRSPYPEQAHQGKLVQGI